MKVSMVRKNLLDVFKAPLDHCFSSSSTDALWWCLVGLMVVVVLVQLVEVGVVADCVVVVGLLVAAAMLDPIVVKVVVSYLI